MYTSVARRGRWQGLQVSCSFLLIIVWLIPTLALQSTAGEPAEAFLNQLRAAGHFELAIEYLNRIDTYPGVSPEWTSAVLLEKAQTYIDAGVAARQIDQRDEFFKQAEDQLDQFLKAGSHPRQSQARLQLGRLQMVRAAQLQGSEPDADKKQAARESYLASRRYI